MSHDSSRPSGWLLARIASARQWVQEHPLVTIILTILSFFFIFLPQWSSSVWQLFSNEPLIPTILRKVNIPALTFSLNWLTAPVGLGVLFVILYLVFTGRAKAEVNHSAEVSTPAPNIICLSENRLDFVELDRHQVFRESNYYGAGALRAVTAAFTNAPSPPHKVSTASNVSAQVEIYEAEWPDRERYRVNYACWLNEESPYVSFGLGTVHHVVIGVFQHKKNGTSGFEPEFTIYGNSPDRNAPLSTYHDRFATHLKIKVRLIIGEHGEFSSEHDFELQHTPGQGFSFGYISEEEKQRRRAYFNSEVAKLIARGEAFVTIPLIEPDWEELYKEIHKWKSEVSTLIHRHHGWPLSSRFTNVSERKPYPHRVPDGYRSFFDELYTEVENLKEIARELGAPVPASDVSKQVEEVAAKRRVKILEDLAGFVEQVSSLLDYTATMRITLGERDLYVWDCEIFDYLSEHLDSADALMMSDTSLEDYTPPENVPRAFHELFRKVHTRLVRLNRLIEEIESGRHPI